MPKLPKVKETLSVIFFMKLTIPVEGLDHFSSFQILAHFLNYNATVNPKGKISKYRESSSN